MSCLDLARNLRKLADANGKCDGALHECLQSFQHFVSETIVSHQSYLVLDESCLSYLRFFIGSYKLVAQFPISPKAPHEGF